MTEYELYHHGIKGQKWGIRRTAAQLGRRVAKAASAAGKATGKTIAKAGKATGKFAGKQAKKAKKAAVVTIKQKHAENKEKRYYKKLHKKKLSQMTDKEITDLTKRVQTEASLKGAKYESRVQNARKFYNNVAKQSVNNLIQEYGKAAIKDAFKDNSKTATNKAAENTLDSTTFKTKLPSKLKDKVNARGNTTVKRGTANTFNNPVTIRHGR